MAQFIPFAKNVLVSGQSVLSVINALTIGQENRKLILEKYGIKNIEPENWYSQENYLKAFEEIAANIGEKTIFAIGKAVLDNAKFPPQITNLEIALNAINQAYHFNHKNGEIGYYKVISFNAKTRKAVMECNNPYPSEFDRGIITAMLRRFKPNDSVKYDVTLDLSLPTRLKGDMSCTYNIYW